MAAIQGRRVLVALEPIVLEGAYAVILEHIAVDQVVQFHLTETAERAAHYDAAIVSDAFAVEVHAGVVIVVPDTQDGGHRPGVRSRGRVTAGDVSRDVDIRDQREVLELLDEHLPLEVSRTERLRAPRHLVD